MFYDILFADTNLAKRQRKTVFLLIVQSGTLFI